MSDRDKLDVQDLPPEINRVRQLPGGSTSLTTGSSNSQSKSASDMPLNEIERQAIIDMLAKTGNNREKAAKLLGIGERTLYRKIKEYNL
jgi:two-component system response regulator HydG